MALRHTLSVRATIAAVCLVAGLAAIVRFTPGIGAPAEGDRRIQDDGTRRMAARLHAIASETSDDRQIYETPSPAEISDRVIALKERQARQWLHEGRTERSIRALHALIDSLDTHSIHDASNASARLRYTLAVAYLRLGEQENCVLNHTSASCILPLREDAVHLQQRGSRGAVRILGSLLDEYPDDLSMRWLWNIAHMTLGTPASEVPDRWHIPAAWIPPESTPRPGRTGRPERSIPPFTDVAPLLGLDAIGLAGGSVTEDFDGDGDLDVLVTSSGVYDQIRLFANNGDGSFTERTDESGLSGITGGLNAVHGDYDNDGFPDVFVLRGGWWGTDGLHPNSLLRNNGDGTFSDVTEAAGLLSYNPSQTAAWGDYDNDGLLDLYVGNESSSMFSRSSELYRNNGNGTFSIVGSETGVDFEGYVKGVVWGDFDNDGRIDLFVSNFGGDNALYRNEGPDAAGRWHFTDVAHMAGVADHTWSFSAWFWDYDNDGWEDLLVLPFDVGILEGSSDALGAVAAEYLGRSTDVEQPHLYHNNGDGTFTDRTREGGFDRVLYAMGSNFGDVDNDGYVDAYVGTGAPDFRAIYPNRLFLNAAGDHFEDATAFARVGHLQKGHGVSLADLDNDGDLDIFTVMGGTYTGDTFQNALFENPGNDHRWISLDLEGTSSNRSAIGARIKLTVETSEGLRQIHTTVNTGGTFGSSSLRRTIGLGSALRVPRMEVRWPATGKVQAYDGVGMDRAYLLREGNAALVPQDRNAFRLGKHAQRRH